MSWLGRGFVAIRRGRAEARVAKTLFDLKRVNRCVPWIKFRRYLATQSILYKSAPHDRRGAILKLIHSLYGFPKFRFIGDGGHERIGSFPTSSWFLRSRIHQMKPTMMRFLHVAAVMPCAGL
jgi:hypothetical protein